MGAGFGIRVAVAVAAHEVGHCAGASVTIIETGLPSTVPATNERALLLDEAQYADQSAP